MLRALGRSCLTHARLAAVAALLVTGAAGCGGDSLSAHPVKQDGSRSYEFEQDDLDRAADASEAVRDYCSGAVSEAQYEGCLSHVDDADIP